MQDPSVARYSKTRIIEGKKVTKDRWGQPIQVNNIVVVIDRTLLLEHKELYNRVKAQYGNSDANMKAITELNYKK